MHSNRWIASDISARFSPAHIHTHTHSIFIVCNYGCFLISFWLEMLAQYPPPYEIERINLIQRHSVFSSFFFWVIGLPPWWSSLPPLLLLPYWNYFIVLRLLTRTYIAKVTAWRLTLSTASCKQSRSTSVLQEILLFLFLHRKNSSIIHIANEMNFYDFTFILSFHRAIKSRHFVVCMCVCVNCIHFLMGLSAD